MAKEKKLTPKQEIKQAKELGYIYYTYTLGDQEMGSVLV